MKLTGKTEREGLKPPKEMLEHSDRYCAMLEDHPKLKELYRNCYLSTWETALKKSDDGTVFVLTGDIPAMWLRDSSAQVNNYVDIPGETAKVIEGVIRRQFRYIDIDPYANAFNEEPNGHGHTTDIPKPGPWVWERKYEIDSLCYPVRLLYRYWKQTGCDALVREILPWAAATILSVFRTEQHHMEKSEYRFTRPKPGKPWGTIYNDGMGTPVTYTGMTWSGFRPSDDGCEYGYLIASNMFASVTLKQMAEMLRKIGDDEIAEECMTLRSEIDDAIAEYGTVEHPVYGRIYVCETDGMGHYNLLDDANVPSLLGAPYIGYVSPDDLIYMNTRRFLLSRDNPYYFEGKYAKGIGSRHTPEGYIWHMALIMQGLTSSDTAEKREILTMLENTDAGTGHMHESFNADDPSEYTREWFTWPEALFAEFIERCADEGILT